MSAPFWVLIVSICAVAIAAIVAMSTAEPQKCDGRFVLSHFVPVVTGKSTVLIPIYRCESAK